MQENFLHFLSSIDCQLSINGNSIGFIDNINVLELDIITKTNKIFISYNPVSNQSNYIPYTFELNTFDTPSTNNEYIKVIPFPNNHYDIILTPFYYYKIEDSKVLLNQQLGKFYISIVSDNMCRINIYSGASIVFTLNTIKLKSAKASLDKDIITIEGIVDDETYYLVVIDTTTFKVLHNDISHSIENSSDYIQTLKNLKDISHHSIVYKINKTDKTCQDYRVYENNECTEPHSNLFIPKVFLEALQTHDETLAKKYLSSQFMSTPFNKLLGYFGNINNIYLNRHLILQDKLNYTVYNGIYKNYNFLLENNKIKDIEEIF